eukprot:scaffold362521_cov73-Cyclotella_meneghiniana.AAC.1
MVEEDFNDWGKFIDLFYSDFKDRRERESDLLEHTVVEMKAIKAGFYERFGFEDGRYNLVDYPYDKKKKGCHMSDQLQQIEAPGINIYKQDEIYKGRKSTKKGTEVEINEAKKKVYKKKAKEILKITFSSVSPAIQRAPLHVMAVRIVLQLSRGDGSEASSQEQQMQ